MGILSGLAGLGVLSFLRSFKMEDFQSPQVRQGPLGC